MGHAVVNYQSNKDALWGYNFVDSYAASLSHHETGWVAREWGGGGGGRRGEGRERRAKKKSCIFSPRVKGINLTKTCSVEHQVLKHQTKTKVTVCIYLKGKEEEKKKKRRGGGGRKNKSLVNFTEFIKTFL